MGSFAIIGVAIHHAPGLLGDDGRIAEQTKIVLLKPEEWTGRRFPLIEQVAGGERLGSSRWNVLLFRRDCEKCAAAIEEYSSVSNEEPDGVMTAMIEVPSNAGGPPLRASCFVAQLDPDRRWYVETPWTLLLNDGVVVQSGL